MESKGIVFVKCLDGMGFSFRAKDFRACISYPPEGTEKGFSVIRLSKKANVQAVIQTPLSQDEVLELVRSELS